MTMNPSLLCISERNSGPLWRVVALAGVLAACGASEEDGQAGSDPSEPSSLEAKQGTKQNEDGFYAKAEVPPGLPGSRLTSHKPTLGTLRTAGDADHAARAAAPVDKELGVTLAALSNTGAARETEVVFANRTSETLTFKSGSASHGKWTTQVPSSIGPATFGRWETESSGFMTGTEGKISYAIGGSGNVNLHWDNPFYGSNGADGSASSGFAIDRVGGEGNRATVFFHLRTTDTEPSTCPWEVASWVLDNMVAGDEVGDSLSWFDEAVAVITTPVFKETDAAGAWGSTGCRTEDGEGIVLNDGQHSTDGFYTIDIHLTKTWGLVFAEPPADNAKFVRLEVRPGTAAHDVVDRDGVPKRGMKIQFQGNYLIDHGSFIENHPDSSLSYSF
jgi:hypothetical protein